MVIDENTSLEELAVLVSKSLEECGISATLSGGAAVSIYSANEYESADLDFVTSERQAALAAAIEPLGFELSKNLRQFFHPNSQWFVEFPPGPLGFGDTTVDHNDIPVLQTVYGPLRIVSPALSIMDRLAAYWYFNDGQCWDQAKMIAERNDVDWERVYAWAVTEGQPPEDIDRLKKHSARSEK